MIDGRVWRKTLKDGLRMDSARLRKAGIARGLGTVVVGSDNGAQAYERRLRRMVREFGVRFRPFWLGTDATLDAGRAVRQLNADPAVHGILVLRPPPWAVSEREAFRALALVRSAIPLRPHLACLPPAFGRSRKVSNN